MPRGGQTSNSEAHQAFAVLASAILNYYCPDWSPALPQSNSLPRWPTQSPVESLEVVDMICSSCRRTFLSRLRAIQTQSSISSSSPRFASSATATGNTTSGQSPSSIVIPGPSASQVQASNSSWIPPSPSDPQVSSSPSQTSPGVTKELKKPTKLKSSVAGGQELKGLGYTKANPRILAKEDHEYPDWLWTLLDEFKTSGDANVDTSSTPPPLCLSFSFCSCFPRSYERTFLL